MVVGAFPIAKLGMLVLKRIAKPVSGLIKRTAKRSPPFKTLAVAPLANLYNNISVRSKMWMLGLGQPRFVPPLNETMSIEMGGDMLGEMCIFAFGAFLLINEVSRQSRNENIKQKKNKLDQEQLEIKIDDLNHKVASQSKEIRQLKTMVGSRDALYDCCWL